MEHNYFNGTLPELLHTCKPGKVFKKKGAISAIIRDVQQPLKNRGYYLCILDGDFGPKTAIVVKAFQTEKGVANAGIIDLPPGCCWFIQFGSMF